VEIRMNSAMTAIYEDAEAARPSTLSRDLDDIARGGFVLDTGRIFLAAPERRRPSTA
jgi:hypothetical protein